VSRVINLLLLIIISSCAQAGTKEKGAGKQIPDSENNGLRVEFQNPQGSTGTINILVIEAPESGEKKVLSELLNLRKPLFSCYAGVGGKVRAIWKTEYHGNKIEAVSNSLTPETLRCLEQKIKQANFKLKGNDKIVAEIEVKFQGQ